MLNCEPSGVEVSVERVLDEEVGLRRRFWAFVALLMLVIGGPTVASADAPVGLSMKVAPAYDGYFKYGEWLPVYVQLENDGPDLAAEIRVRVTGGAGTMAFAAPAALPSGSRKRIPVYVLPNNFSHELGVELVSGDEVLLGAKVAVQPQPNSTYLVGVVASERGAIALAQGAALPGREREKVFVDLPLSDLPERAEGLRSFDCLILNDVDTSLLGPERGASLEAWVRQGGRLVIGGGAGAARTVAGLPESLLPLRPQGLAEVDALPGLAVFADADPIRVPGPFALVTGESAAGHPLATQEGLPLVQELALGRGTVDVVTLDLAVSPFDAWTGTTAFWEVLLAPGAAYPEWLPPDVSVRQMRSGSMNYALSNLPSLDLPSIRGLGILLVFYVVLVGPVNYVVLRWRKRLHWAWITIPLITLAFSAGAFGLGYALHGTDLILNKIAIVELRSDGAADVLSYVGLFSPSQQSYEIQVQDEGLLSPLNPEYDPWGAGGLGAGGEMTFVQSHPASVRGLTVNQWSMQTFMVEGSWADVGQVVGDLSIEGDALVGTVRNETAHTLTDMVLILGNRFTRLGDLSPGQEAAVEMDLLNMMDGFIGAPLSYRLFEADLSNPGFGGPAREIQLKQTVIDSFLQGGMFGPTSSIRFSGMGGLLAQGPLLIGWLDEAPPDVWVSGNRPSQQTTALLTAPLTFRLPDTGVFSLPPGLISGDLIETPVEGGPCGPNGLSIYIGRGQATFEFQIPDEFGDLQVTALKLNLESDGGWGLVPDTALYDWDAEDWVGVEGPETGLNEIPDAASFVSDDGRVRVQLSSEGGSSGCVYVALGLEGRR